MVDNKTNCTKLPALSRTSDHPCTILVALKGSAQDLLLSEIKDKTLLLPRPSAEMDGIGPA